MDTGILLRIINEINEDELTYHLQDGLNAILSYFSSGDMASVTASRTKYEESVQNSHQSNYVATDYSVLEKLGAKDYFGVNQLAYLDKIFHGQVHEVSSELTNFIQRRQEYLTKLAATGIQMTSLGLKTSEISKDSYELGFSFPEPYSDLNELLNVLKDTKHFLILLASSTQGDMSLRITGVSNGSIEFFIQAGSILAEHFEKALETSVLIYEALKAYGELQAKYSEFKEELKARMEDAAKMHFEEKQNNLIEKFISTLGITEEEQKSQVRISFNNFLRHIESGVVAEVRTPNVSKPDDISGDSDEQTQQDYALRQRAYDLKKRIDKHNQEIYILQQNNFDGTTIAMLQSANGGNRKSKKRIDQQADKD